MDISVCLSLRQKRSLPHCRRSRQMMRLYGYLPKIFDNYCWLLRWGKRELWVSIPDTEPDVNQSALMNKGIFYTMRQFTHILLNRMWQELLEKLLNWLRLIIYKLLPLGMVQPVERRNDLQLICDMTVNYRYLSLVKMEHLFIRRQKLLEKNFLIMMLPLGGQFLSAVA